MNERATKLHTCIADLKRVVVTTLQADCIVRTRTRTLQLYFVNRTNFEFL